MSDEPALKLSPDEDPPAYALGGGAAAAAAAEAAEPEAEPEWGADEQAQLEALLARKAAASSSAENTVRIKVEAPHEAMSFGGYTVGSEFQEVPARVAAGLHEAAASAGVTLTQEG